MYSYVFKLITDVLTLGLVHVLRGEIASMGSDQFLYFENTNTAIVR